MTQRPRSDPPSRPGEDPHPPAPQPAGRARVVEALERARSVLGWLARAAGRLALAALIAGALIWWAVVRDMDGWGVGTVVTAAFLLLPPVILLLFVVALRTLISVPDRIRQAPAAVRDRLGEVRARLGEVADAGGRGMMARLRSLLRLLWAILSSRELVEIVGPAAILLNPGMLGAAVVAAIGALLEILAGIVALIWLALT
jgi:hypothetical protein